jgi:hypothetical protein
MTMEELRAYNDNDETLRQWPPREDDRELRSELEAAKEEEVPFHVPRD